MVKTINMYAFERAFKDAGRGEQFSYDGLKALFEYIEEYEDSTGSSVELDVIALCVEYSELTLGEVFDMYPSVDTLSELDDHTTVILVSDNFEEEAPFDEEPDKPDPDEYDTPKEYAEAIISHSDELAEYDKAMKAYLAQDVIIRDF